MAIIKKRYIERRKYKRKDLYCLIRYVPPREDGRNDVVISSIRNIGGGGVLFKSSEYMPMGTSLSIAINLFPMGKVINASAKVVRCEKNKKSGQYLIGVEFVKISDEDRSAIIGFTENI